MTEHKSCSADHFTSGTRAIDFQGNHYVVSGKNNDRRGELNNRQTNWEFSLELGRVGLKNGKSVVTLGRHMCGWNGRVY